MTCLSLFGDENDANDGAPLEAITCDHRAPHHVRWTQRKMFENSATTLPSHMMVGRVDDEAVCSGSCH